MKAYERLVCKELGIALPCPMVTHVNKLLDIAAVDTPSPISITVPLPKGLAGGQAIVPSMPLWDVLLRTAAEVPLEDFAHHRGGGIASPEWFHPPCETLNPANGAHSVDREDDRYAARFSTRCLAPPIHMSVERWSRLTTV